MDLAIFAYVFISYAFLPCSNSILVWYAFYHFIEPCTCLVVCIRGVAHICMRVHSVCFFFPTQIDYKFSMHFEILQNDMPVWWYMKVDLILPEGTFPPSKLLNFIRLHIVKYISLLFSVISGSSVLVMDGFEVSSGVS